MVLSALADLIYKFYLLLYYFLKICAFIGCLLFDIVYHVTSAVGWCMSNAHVFYAVVYEDNRYLIQDVKSFISGIADFFINNISSAYSACRSLSETIRCIVLAFKALPGHIFETAKQGLVLVGEAVWFLYTLPVQCAILLYDLAVHLTITLTGAAQAAVLKCVDSTLAFVHYTTQQIPLEATCGLGLLALTYYCRTPRRIAIKFLLTATRYLYRLLRLLMQTCIRSLEMIGNQIVILITSILEYIATHPIRESHVRYLSRIHASAGGIYDTAIQPMLMAVYRVFTIRTTASQPAPVRAASVRRPETPSRTTIGLCIICEDNDRSVAFVPCGHICVCKSCAINLCYYNPVCPLCRAYINQKLEIYI